MLKVDCSYGQRGNHIASWTESFEQVFVSTAQMDDLAYAIFRYGGKWDANEKGLLRKIIKKKLQDGSVGYDAGERRHVLRRAAKLLRSDSAVFDYA